MFCADTELPRNKAGRRCSTARQQKKSRHDRRFVRSRVAIESGRRKAAGARTAGFPRFPIGQLRIAASPKARKASQCPPPLSRSTILPPRQMPAAQTARGQARRTKASCRGPNSKIAGGNSTRQSARAAAAKSLADLRRLLLRWTDLDQPNAVNPQLAANRDRKSTRLNSSHLV